MERKCKGVMQPDVSLDTMDAANEEAELCSEYASDEVTSKKQDKQQKRKLAADNVCSDQQDNAKARVRARRSSSPSCASSTAACSDDDETQSKEQAKASEPLGGGKYTLPPPVYERERFLATEPSDVMEKLERYGIAIVPSVLDEAKCQIAFDGLMDALEGVFPDFKRDEPITWRALRDNGAKHAMLLQTHCLGWCQAAVDIRQVLGESVPSISQYHA